MKKLLTLLLITLISKDAFALCLKEKFAHSKSGDYIVSELNHSLTLLRVHEISKDTLTLEEISFPSSAVKLGKDEIEAWLSKGAEGNTSWHLLEFDLNQDKIKDCFSFTRNAWLLFNENDSLLIKLLSLPLKKIPDENRKKIGPRPLNGPDLRKIWNPPLIVNGKPIKSPAFDAFFVTLPSDGSPLSNKRFEIYFDKKNSKFPFPYWAQITDDSNAAFKIRICDSGENLFSPTKEMPRRPNF